MGIGISNPGYDPLNVAQPIKNNATGPSINKIQNNLTYDNTLGKSKDTAGEENVYDPYDMPTGSNAKPDVNVYDEGMQYSCRLNLSPKSQCKKILVILRLY
jgi:hypothetical protein